jgi:molybdate transport system ATP-binding protein
MTILDCEFRFVRPGFTLEVAFSLEQGMTALCGPSGAGKTTTLELLAGLLRAERGHCVLRGRTLFDSARRVWLPPEQRRIGLVRQQHCLFPHLSVRQNLLFGHGRPGTTRPPLATLVEVLELESLLERYPLSLSGGQQQRVALGRAVLRGADLLLLDEPLAPLEAPLKEQISVYLDRLWQEWQMPMLLVSHQAADVQRLATHVIELKEGRVMNAEFGMRKAE